jgi:hypothetical protein
MSGGKTLCGWKKKEITGDMERLLKVVGDPRYVCQECCRVASKKKYLCEPMPLKKRD